MTDTVDLGKDLETYVEALVRSGRYRSRGEVLREGVRLIEQAESGRASLDRALRRGLADSDADRVTPIDAVADRLIAKYEARAKEQAAS